MINQFRKEFAFLSNFFECSVLLDGIMYPSSEHAYMAMKTEDVEKRQCIAMLNTAGDAKRYGRSIALRPNWEAIKDAEMAKVLSAKFHQNKHLGELLQATGTEELIEGNWWGDTYWGVCLKTNQGKNMLGKLLMQLRETLNKKETIVSNNIIIAGGRDFNDRALMLDRIQELEKRGFIYASTTLICGMAKGADLMARGIFLQAGLNVRDMPAEWEKLGKRAGYARNESMATIADMAMVFWDGKSPGSKHMIETMDKLGKPVFVVSYNI